MKTKNDNQFIDYCEDKMYQSFDIFQEDDISRIDDQNESQTEIQDKQNNLIDNSNLYLNLSNKVSFPDGPYNKSKSKCKNNIKLNALQTTFKTNNQTGANITYTEWIKNKKNRKKLAHQETHEISVDTISDKKSYSLNKINIYSDFDQESNRDSNNTELNRSGEHTKHFKNLNAGVIKGFCSSIDSSQSIIDNQVFTPEKEVDIKQKFYSSGNGFHNTDWYFNSNQSKGRKEGKLDKSQNNINNELNAEFSQEINRTYVAC